MKRFSIIDSGYDRNLLTRQEIINLWSDQKAEYLNMYCCPECRDLLVNEKDYLTCMNEHCKNEELYKAEEDGICQ